MSVTPNEMLSAAKRLGFNIPSDHEEDYLQLLAKTDRSCQLILSQPDYFPLPQSNKFPRSNVHLPDPAENTLRAWAWKAEAGSPVDTKSETLLAGKTVVLKDTICMAEVPLLFGTDAFEGYIPGVDATVVDRVLTNGGRILGKAACENFSHGATSSSSPFGPVENPYTHGFTTGGSSSGCGALVGSGQADMAIGGDQGGSIRIPASFCGIVGLKPTFGLVPYTGVLSSDSGTDHVGPMAANVLDTAKLLQAIAGYDNIDDRQLGAPSYNNIPRYADDVLASRTQGIKGLKIGVLKEAMQVKDMASSVETLLQKAIERFEGLGAVVEEASVPTFSLSGHLLHVINKFASGVTRAGKQVGRRGLYINDYWTKLLPWDDHKYTKAKYFVTGTAMSCEYGFAKYPTAYGRAMNLSRRLRDEIDENLEEFDLLLMPTCPQPAQRHIASHLGPLGWAEHSPSAVAITGAFNLSGHPALSVPIGFAPPLEADRLKEGDLAIKLPVGMMLVGKYWDESKLLQVADAWEQSVDWKTIHSDI